jgi:hypothetical protein
MDALEVLQQRMKLVEGQVEVNNKATAIEFEKIGKAFAQLGNLLDLLYLETSVLIETLAKKEVINQEEFSKTMEETAKKIEETIKKAAEKPEEEKAPEKL